MSQVPKDTFILYRTTKKLFENTKFHFPVGGSCKNMRNFAKVSEKILWKGLPWKTKLKKSEIDLQRQFVFPIFFGNTAPSIGKDAS